MRSSCSSLRRITARLDAASHVRRGKTARLWYDTSKVAVFDDRLLRIGSTNLNNRSLGYDTECDVAIEADDASGIASMSMTNPPRNGTYTVIRVAAVGH